MKLTQDTIDKYCEAIKQGSSIEGACNFCRINRSTRDRWRERAEQLIRLSKPEDEEELTKYDELCLEFYLREGEAQGKIEATMVKRVMMAADTTWQAAAWFLERRFPDRYGRVVRQLQEAAEVSHATDPTSDPTRSAGARQRVLERLGKNEGV